MNKKNKKQYYKIKIDPNKVMTERDVRETLYGQVPKSPFEILGYELSYGYFNKYVVLIISIYFHNSVFLIFSFFHKEISFFSITIHH